LRGTGGCTFGGSIPLYRPYEDFAKDIPASGRDAKQRYHVAITCRNYVKPAKLSFVQRGMRVFSPDYAWFTPEMNRRVRESDPNPVPDYMSPRYLFPYIQLRVPFIVGAQGYASESGFRMYGGEQPSYQVTGCDPTAKRRNIEGR
jgi:hypothetical protein